MKQLRIGKCKIFKGRIDCDGYGQMRSIYSHGWRHASRVVFEKQFGKIPKNMVVMHVCDNRACVRLSHLKLGTQSDNIRDMHTKGRWCNRKGEKHPLHKINNKDVKQILIKYNTKNYTQKQLAEQFSIDQSDISRIVNKKIWKHIN